MKNIPKNLKIDEKWIIFSKNQFLLTFSKIDENHQNPKKVNKIQFSRYF